MKCTIFKNFATPIKNKSLIEISKDITSDKYKTEVEEIRHLYSIGRQDEAKAKKKNLLAFTPSATFKGKRLLGSLDQYSGIIHLDFDNIGSQLEKTFKKICSIPYTFICFRSPSGVGLKVFIRVTGRIDQHENSYQMIQKFYEDEVGVAPDSKCKDITRLCFMSHDSQLYYNSCSQIFNEQIYQNRVSPDDGVKKQLGNDIWTSALEECLSFTERKRTYYDGGRNDFIYLFASNANRRGIPEHIVTQYCIHRFDLAAIEINSTVHSAYTHHVEEFGKYTKTESNGSDENILMKTPYIPEQLYKSMPDILRKGAEAFELRREKDVFLLSALAVLSGCLPGVHGIYNGEEALPNLFSFVVAPSASGKRAMKFAKMLADAYHRSVVQSSKDSAASYKIRMAECLAIRTKKRETTEEKPPNFKVVFIPADTSYAKIIWHLEQNEGFGIICETEADTMGQVFKREWGGYSHMLRKLFQNESVSKSRIGNNEFIEIDRTQVSVAMTGTPGQTTGIITCAENGLFSRFLYYVFKAEIVWKDVSPSGNKTNLTSHFKKLSEQVFQMVQFLQNEETFIDLTAQQWRRLNETFSVWLQEVAIFTAEEATSTVKRLGLILYRIAMQFTAIRKFESAEATEKIFCRDDDFNTALQLVEVYLQHAIFMFNNLPGQVEESHFRHSDNKRKFFEALPDEFTRKQAVAFGAQFQISTRTVDALLRSLLGKYLVQSTPGKYQKI